MRCVHDDDDDASLIIAHSRLCLSLAAWHGRSSLRVVDNSHRPCSLSEKIVDHTILRCLARKMMES